MARAAVPALTKNPVVKLLVEVGRACPGASLNFDYARRWRDALPDLVTCDDVLRSLRAFSFLEEEYPRVYEHIERRRKLTKGPFQMFSIRGLAAAR
jgi:hypothetical protein